jgi:large subunit ribosomal protein L2
MKINQIYKPIKRLTKGKISTGGRNCHGHITTFHRGGGHKRLYRIVDFKRNKIEEWKVIDLQYDPSRTGKLALILSKNGILSYILAAEGLKPGDIIKSGLDGIDPIIGNSLPLKNIPIGTKIFNIELIPGKGGQLIRSGGCSGILIGHEMGKTLIRLASGQSIYLNNKNIATIGEVGMFPKSKLIKAGQMRWRGRRPIVRGVAMNPIDHPHGGGEGKSKGRPSVTPWGKPTKGYKTRNPRKKRNGVRGTLPQVLVNN